MAKKQSAAAQLTELVGTPLREIREEFISVAEMQNQIMPDPSLITVFGEFDIFGMTIPTAIVGGDFYDFIDVGARFELEGKLGVVIADASGHGLSAAMLIRDFNTALYTAISFQAFYAHDTTPLLFDKINRRMYRSSLPNQFISAVYAELHEDGVVRYMNAGHLNPLLFKKGGEVRELDVGGPVLGALLELPRGYQVGEEKIEKGETLVFYTDGITETFNPAGAEYGVDRLKAVVRARPRVKARRLFDLIIEDVEEFAEELRQPDDRTLIIIRR